ncbi:MAG: AMP-binding protein [Alphaproteobacteria bacterium]|jgi:1-acyl-sn-glycerol-3-phosphate acyltransferase|nr:AMP-binding protein [Alphaproteobacteria bacterium]
MASTVEEDLSREESEARTARLLEVCRQLVLELHPHKAATLALVLDSSLERDLGLDSLGRVELLMRLEQGLEVQLPEQLLASAESPRDLLRAVANAGPARPRGPAPEVLRSAEPSRAEALPLGATTLVEMLDWHVLTHPDRPHVRFLAEDGSEHEISYREFRERAREVAAGLRQRDVMPGQGVAIMLPTGLDFFYAFFGILLVGAVPVPNYPPARLSQIEDHLRRQAGILANARVPVLITVPEAKPLARYLRSQVHELAQVVTVDDLRQPPGDQPWPVVKPDDLAFLQYTSGSTGAPKGVMLTHANLMANVRAMGLALKADSTDVFVSWLPLYHDMGLIGAWLGSMYHAVKLVVMSPLTFLAHPERWLWVIHEHRGSISAAPNFAYELCTQRIDEAALEGLDLGSWRIAANGAEPVIPETMEAFIERFAPYGFEAASMKPVYGLAESSVGLAFPPLERGPLVDRIRREPFTAAGQAIPAAEDDDNPLAFVACGQPLPGHEFRIVDDGGRELPERQEGRLQFRGPSSTSGYFRNPEATKEMFDGDWIDTGDFAYMWGGDAFLTGRRKDIIIKAGRNIYPQEVERAVGDLDDVRTGCVAVFGYADAHSGTERLVVMAETRLEDAAPRQQLERDIEGIVSDLLGAPPDDVALVPPQAVLKTSSGKIRRAACRDLYRSGAADKGRGAVWLQFARLAGASLVPEARRLLRRGGDYLYAGWWWLVIALAAVLLWPVLTVLPWRRFNQGLLRQMARLVFGLTGTPLKVRGLDELPPGTAIICSNHASYIDPLVLAAALPRSFGFVAKGELRSNLLIRLFLDHLGVFFVERFDPRQGVEDTGQILATVKAGTSIALFPEGTLTRMPGLLPFRMGAFQMAAEGRIPVVTVAIRGSRYVLRDGTWFPRRGSLTVSVSESVEPDGADWAAAIRLRDAVREKMLRTCGEPDLAYETSQGAYQDGGKN